VPPPPSSRGQILSCAWVWDGVHAPILGRCVPDPLCEDLPELLAPGGMRTPTIYVLLQIFISKRTLERSPMQIEIDHIGRRERSLWQRGVEQLVDHFATCDTDFRTGLSSRMCGNDDPQAWSGGRKREIREVKERSTRSRFGMARLLVWGLCETSLNRHKTRGDRSPYLASHTRVPLNPPQWLHCRIDRPDGPPLGSEQEIALSHTR
jgi:hypothetical protein